MAIYQFVVIQSPVDHSNRPPSVNFYRCPPRKTRGEHYRIQKITIQSDERRNRAIDERAGKGGEIKSNSPVEPRFKKLPRGISIITSTKRTSLCIATGFMRTDGTSVFFEAINYQSLHSYKKGNVPLLTRNPSFWEQTVLFLSSVLSQLNF